MPQRGFIFTLTLSYLFSRYQQETTKGGVELKQIILCSLLIILSGIITANGGIISDFDSGDEGWGVGGGLLTYSNSGGNPGGFLRFQDTVAGAATFLEAVVPTKFLGDLGVFAGGTIAFDIKASPTTSPLDFVGIIDITGNGVTMTNDAIPFAAVTSEWQTFSVTINATGWGVSEAQFSSILSDVTEITLNLEANNFAIELTDLDNFSLQTQAQVVPEPSSFALIISGILGTIYMRKRRNQR